METTQPRNITTADALFNDPTDSIDLVIRTTDNVDFFVLSGLLCLKSPSSFFRHVLQTNQHTEERDSLPVLDVKEDSEAFRIILLLCYPCGPPEIKSVEQLVTVGKALNKYCMDYAWKRFVQTLIASSLIKEQALRIFAHAVANGWKELGEVAAKNTLYVPLDALETELEDLRCIDALQYVRLREYHRKCGRAAQAIVTMTPKNIRMLWLKEKMSELLFLQPSIGSKIHVPCRWCGGYIGGRPCVLGDVLDQNVFYMHDNWLSDYLSAVMAEALRRPCPEVTLGENIIAQAIMKSISLCNHVEWSAIASNQIHRFATLVAEEIDRLISLEPLNVDWTK
ncbi:hypothetical protein ARMGADRAFT_992303 [Armillaria gallica]|uniref:BTB domain-containing protein n=1 Tax=Armillaria gallica TaxID=47427 RepID=A0A2H3DEK5_ARMGA|nr:hypothetical protein ARMGADRAFT_992303 [Armillaria gallica]